MSDCSSDGSLWMNSEVAEVLAEMTAPQGEDLEFSPPWVEDVELGLKAKVAGQWKLTAAGELLHFEDIPAKFAACANSGMVFVAQREHIYAFEIQKGLAAHVSSMIASTTVSHVACGGIYNAMPVGAAVDVSGAVLVFHTSTPWTGDRIIPELRFQLGTAPSSDIKVGGVQFVDSDELCVLLGNTSQSMWIPSTNTLVGFRLDPQESPHGRTISSSFPQNKHSINFFGLSTCRIVGDIGDHASAEPLRMPQFQQILAKHMLRCLDIRTLLCDIVRLGSKWRDAVERILRSPYPEIYMQVDFGFKEGYEGSSFEPPRTFFTFHTPVQGEICELAGYASSSVNVSLAPALNGIVAFGDDAPDEDSWRQEILGGFEFHGGSRVERSTQGCVHSSQVLRVCVVLRRFCTAHVGLKVLTKRLEDITDSDGLSGDSYGIAVIGRTVLLLNSNGILRSISLRVQGFLDQCTFSDDGQDECLLESEDGGRVIEEVLHDEPPAIMSPGMAAEIEQQQWAGRVQCLRSDCAGSKDDSPLDGRVVLLTCNRRPESMVAELTMGNSLRGCRQDLEDAGYSWKLPSGSLIFVHPEQYPKVISTTSMMELKPFNIVISLDLEYLLEEALATVGHGAWMKARRHIDTPGDANSAVSQRAAPASDRNELDQSHDGIEVKPEIDRTMLSFCPQRRSPKSVTQSTTEARSRAGLNPRRVCAPSEDL